MSRIGFIGLGNMGLPMAINLATDHDVIGFDLSPETKAALVAAGGAAAETMWWSLCCPQANMLRAFTWTTQAFSPTPKRALC